MARQAMRKTNRVNLRRRTSRVDEVSNRKKQSLHRRSASRKGSPKRSRITVSLGQLAQRGVAPIHRDTDLQSQNITIAVLKKLRTVSRIEPTLNEADSTTVKRRRATLAPLPMGAAIGEPAWNTPCLE